MKYLVFVCSLIISVPSFSTDNGEEKSIYLNDRMEVTSEKEAAYVCHLMEASHKGYFFKAYYLSGELKMEGWFMDEEMKKPHGEFTYYYRSGTVESTGEFRDGVKYGIWKRYTPEGEEKPEKIYANLQMLKAIEEIKK